MTRDTKQRSKMLEEQEDKEEQKQSNNSDNAPYHANDNLYGGTRDENEWIDMIAYQNCEDNKKPRAYNGDLRPQVRM